ncbi:MAG: DNA polymerase III subunit beta [Candidatus Eisenbacteria sp.]|nr:DNA polymerase III subunit beta [Candidatus Eisenbacteria bacterium]
MKFTLAQKDLVQAIDTVVAVVPPKSTLPVLANVLVRAAENTVSFRASDLDISVVNQVNADVAEEGEVTIPARRFHEIARELPGQNVNVAVSAEQIEISCGASTFKLMGMKGEDFPSLPSLEEPLEFSIPAASLQRLIRKTSYAVSSDETRGALNGVFWEIEPQQMSMVATDGHRLARLVVKGKFETSDALNAIIPPKALGQIVRILGGFDGDVSVSLGKNYVAFRMASAEVHARILEGPFPKYQQVIPKDNDKRVIVQRTGLVAAMRRVAILSDALTRQVRLHLESGHMALGARAADVGEATEGIEVDYTGDELKIGFNASYLLDALRHMDGESVAMSLKGPVGAGVIEETSGLENEEYLCLVMPLRLAE